MIICSTQIADRTNIIRLQITGTISTGFDKFLIHMVISGLVRELSVRLSVAYFGWGIPRFSQCSRGKIQRFGNKPAGGTKLQNVFYRNRSEGKNFMLSPSWNFLAGLIKISSAPAEPDGWRKWTSWIVNYRQWRQPPNSAIWRRYSIRRPADGREEARREECLDSVCALSEYQAWC